MGAGNGEPFAFSLITNDLLGFLFCSEFCKESKVVYRLSEREEKRVEEVGIERYFKIRLVMNYSGNQWLLFGSFI